MFLPPRHAFPFVPNERLSVLLRRAESAHLSPWFPPAGPVLFRYNVGDMARELHMEVGVPVADVVEGDAEIVSGVLPAGRYATLTHVGHPSELAGVTAALLGWAAREGLTWDKVKTPDGERWGCRLEWYKSDPAEEPDMTKWETELAFRLVD